MSSRLLPVATAILVAILVIACNPGGGGQSTPGAPAPSDPTIVDYGY